MGSKLTENERTNKAETIHDEKVFLISLHPIKQTIEENRTFMYLSYQEKEYQLQ